MVCSWARHLQKDPLYPLLNWGRASVIVSACIYCLGALHWWVICLCCYLASFLAGCLQIWPITYSFNLACQFWPWCLPLPWRCGSVGRHCPRHYWVRTQQTPYAAFSHVGTSRSETASPCPQTAVIHSTINAILQYNSKEISTSL